MQLPTLDSLNNVRETEHYQQQLGQLYQRITDNGYEQLTLIVDLNVYDTDILPLLPHYQQLTVAALKRIHHTFERDVTLINVALDSSQGQQVVEQLLALAVYENNSDSTGSPHGRSIGLWLFDQPITEQLKNDLYLMGQAYGFNSHKRRYLRYWDPRVFALLLDIWTPQQQGQIYQLGITELYYLDWQGELAQVALSKPSTVIPDNEKIIRQPLPFSFSQQQWQLLEQVEWMNMIIRQLKSQITITKNILSIIFAQARRVSKNQIDKNQAVKNIAVAITEQ